MNIITYAIIIFPIALNAMSHGNPLAKSLDISVGENQSTTASLMNNVVGGKKPYAFMEINSSHNNFAEIEIQKDGTVNVTAKNNFTGTTEFEYKAIDSLGKSSNTAKITVHIQ